jgi:uncharacterized membrane protein YkoI
LGTGCGDGINKNGRDLFEVELDNGQDVKVDATTGEILYSEARD